jgi:S-DNA-T family DNA segregation ATPase FtsK/SpoIIIE
VAQAYRIKPSSKRSNHFSVMPYLSWLVRASGLLIFGSIAIYLLMALLSFRAADPAWTHTAPGVAVTNMGGMAGAWFADIAFYFFGGFAYLFPLGAAFCGWRLFRPGTLQNLDAEIIVFRTFGFLVILGSGCSLAALHLNSVPIHPHASAGGILGSFLAAWLGNAFNVLGVTAFLVVLFAAGFTLATGFSWLDLLDGIGTATLKLFDGGSKLLVGLRSWLEAEETAVKSDNEINNEPQLNAAPNVSKPTPEIKPVTAQTERPNPFAPPPSPGAPTPLKTPPPRLGKRQRIEPVIVVTAEQSDIVEAPSFTAQEAPVLEQVNPPAVDKVWPDTLSPSPVDSDPAPVKLSDLAPVYQAGQLSTLLASSVYQANTAPTLLILGEVADDYPLVIDLARLPHVLIVGADAVVVTTLLHTLLLSLLYKARPRQLQLLLLDGQAGVLTAYSDLPHLLAPITNRVDQTVNTLVWCKKEIERRRKLLVAAGAQDIADFNHRVSVHVNDDAYADMPDQTDTASAALPLIAVVVTELADIVDTMGDWVEGVFAKLAAEGPTLGLHLILASQRPSSEVLTTLIKAHIPARLVSKVDTVDDSRLVLDRAGAERLSHDELLYLPPGADTPKQLRAIRVGRSEIQRVTDYWKQNPSPTAQR